MLKSGPSFISFPTHQHVFFFTAQTFQRSGPECQTYFRLCEIPTTEELYLYEDHILLYAIGA